KNLGVKVACNEIDRQTFFDQRNQRCAYTMFRQSWSADYNNPQDWFDYLFVSHAPSGGSCYSNPNLDSLVATADSKPVGRVLSHLASARIRSIETSAARSVPGVVDVVVAGDLPDQDVAGPDQPLATERVFYAGQPVAAVIATSEAAAHDGAAAVEVDLEETEVVADAET